MSRGQREKAKRRRHARPVERAVRRAALAACVALAAVLALGPGTAGAATITVDTPDDELADGGGDCALREAIEATNTDATVDGCVHDGVAGQDKIELPADTYNLTIAPVGTDDNADGDLDVDAGAGLTIAGADEATTIVDADGLDRVLHVVSSSPAAPILLQELTLRDGSRIGNTFSDAGGGLNNNAGDAELTLDDVTVADNSTETGGGGIAQQGGTGSLALVDSTVSGNMAVGAGAGVTQGGGLFSGLADTTLTRTEVGNNRAHREGSIALGGGIYATSGIELDDSEVTDNYAGDPGDGDADDDTGNGAGVYLHGAGQSTIAESLIDQNTSEGLGGGIATAGEDDVDATVRSSAIAQNTAGDSGAAILYNGRDDGLLEIADSVVSDNAVIDSDGGVVEGGGVSHGGSGGEISVERSAILDNSITSAAATGPTGAGLASTNAGDVLRVRDSTIAGNFLSGGTFQAGGGVFSFAETTLVNTTFNGNAAPLVNGRGGGLYGSDATLINVTLHDNVAGDPGGGSGIGGDGTMTIASSVVDQGPIAVTAGCDTGINLVLVSAGNNIDATDTCDFDEPSDLVNTDPLLAALADNGGPDAGRAGSPVALETHALMVGSPAIDHVPAAECLDETSGALSGDERGFARPLGPACDAGAYERAVCQGVLVDDDSAIFGTGGADDPLDGTAGADVIFGGGGDDVIAAGGGNDTVCAGTGDDEVRGEDGDDDLDGEDGTDAASFAGGAAVDASLDAGTSSGQGADALAGFENLIGSSNGDQLEGDGDDNVIAPGPGAQNDNIEGLGGFGDTADFSGGAPVDVDLDAGTSVGQGTDSLAAVENVIATDGADTLVGDAEDNSLSGGAGADELAGASGMDTLSGGADEDTALYQGAAGPVTANLASSTAADDGDGGADALNGIENLTGSSDGDDLTGDGGANELDGGAGSDELDGQGGADQVDGGTEDDTLFIRDGVGDTAFCGPGDDFAQSDLAGVDMFPNADCETIDFFTTPPAPPPPPPPPPSAGASQLPPNDFAFGELERKKKKGIAFLTVIVPGPGEVGLAGKGIKGRGLTAAARRRVSTDGGEVRLKIKPAKKGKKARRLRRRLRAKGKAKVKVRVSYLPTGGTVNTRSKKVKLIRRSGGK